MSAPHLPRGGGAVMASRVEAPDSLDDFPTPPWATRALCGVVLPYLRDRCETDFDALVNSLAWEPTANRGLMVDPLREVFGAVYASDVHDYGCGYDVGHFPIAGGGLGLDTARPPGQPDWIIFNPPFNLALEFVLAAIAIARQGVAVLARTALVEGATRYKALWAPQPPTLCAHWVERVPMHRARWEPDGDTTTAYTWFVWIKDAAPMAPFWIPPGQRRRRSRPDDRERFAQAVVNVVAKRGDQPAPRAWHVARAMQCDAAHAVELCRVFGLDAHEILQARG